MTRKYLMICLFLLNATIPTNFQVINDRQDRCNSNGDNYLFLKVRELQLELSALKKEFAEYKNESIDKQTALEDELKRQGKYFTSNSIIMTALHYVEGVTTGI